MLQQAEREEKSTAAIDHIYQLGNENELYPNIRTPLLVGYIIATVLHCGLFAIADAIYDLGSAVRLRS